MLVLSTIVAGSPGVSHYGIRVQTPGGGGQARYILAHPSGQQPAFLSVGGLIDFYQVLDPLALCRASSSFQSEASPLAGGPLRSYQPNTSVPMRRNLDDTTSLVSSIGALSTRPPSGSPAQRPPSTSALPPQQNPARQSQYDYVKPALSPAPQYQPEQYVRPQDDFAPREPSIRSFRPASQDADK